MDLQLDDDQRMLAQSIRQMTARPERDPQEDWRAFVELGLTRIPFADADGGLSLGRVETMLVAEACGTSLVTVPYLSSIVMVGAAIDAAPASAERSRHLAAVMDGATLYAIADHDLVEARCSDEAWRLSGELSLVLDGDRADFFGIYAEQGLFVVSADAAGATRRSYRLHGGGGAADLQLENVAAEWLGAGSPTAALEAGIAFLAAEASCAIAVALDLTIAHLKTRHQFGQPLATNQALQHRIAEMGIELEQARSAAIYAASLDNEPNPLERARGHAAVKAAIGTSARFVAEQAVQLHGGIGVSDEHVISRYFRRLTAIGLLLGDSDVHLARLASIGGFTDTALPT